MPQRYLRHLTVRECVPLIFDDRKQGITIERTTQVKGESVAEEKEKAPEGRFMGTVKVGTKGQIVIPKDARDMFHIEPGDTLLVLADINQGIALVRNDSFLDMAKAIFRAQQKAPEEADE